MDRFSGVAAVGAISAAIVSVASGVLLYLSVRQGRSRAGTLGYSAVMAGAAGIVVYYLSVADSTRLAFSLAGAILAVAGLIALLIEWKKPRR